MKIDRFRENEIFIIKIGVGISVGINLFIFTVLLYNILQV